MSTSVGRGRQLFVVVVLSSSPVVLAGGLASVTVEHRIREQFPAVAEKLDGRVVLELSQVIVDGRFVRGFSPVSEGDSRGSDFKPLFPLRYDGPTVIEGADQRIVLRPVGARPARAEVVNSGVVYPAAYASTDVLHVVGRDRSEEFLLLANEASPKRFEYEVVETQGVGDVALRDGGVVFRGARDALRIEKPYVIDAGGHRSDTAARWELARAGGRARLTLRLAAQGLAYPLLIDPSWSPVGRLDSPRVHHTATLLFRGEVLVAGGYNNGVHLSAAELYDPGRGSWRNTGSLASRRTDHTATLLPNGKVLVSAGCTFNPNAYLSSAELYDPAVGAWTATGSLQTGGRCDHTATLLADGRVLVAGGRDGTVRLRSAELYNPATGTWTATGQLGVARNEHVAVLLANGKVLVAGGNGAPFPYEELSSSEIYDPSTGTWTAAGPLNAARTHARATRLPDGRVLVSGGTDGGVLSSAELFDPGAGTWSLTGSLTRPRSAHSMALLPDGRVLAFGGSGDNTAEVYDPGGDAWTATVSLNVARGGATATVLPTGDVLAVGGGTDPPNTAEVYISAAGSWMSTAAMSETRRGHTAKLLANGQVLVAGGIRTMGGQTVYTDTAQVYDPETGSWGAVPPMASPRSGHSMTLLFDGRVLVAGGSNNGSYLEAAELYDPASGSWTAAGSMGIARSGHAATLLSDGRVLVAGGFGNSYLSSCEIYDPGTGTWTPTGSLGTGRSNPKSALLPDGRVLVAGGYNSLFGGGELDSAEVYDPRTGTWTATDSLNTPRDSHTMIPLSSGDILALGGYDNPTYHATTEVFESAAGTWTLVGSLATGRRNAAAALLPNGKVLVMGGRGSAGYLASAEMYDPASRTWFDAGALLTAREGPSATLLPDGEVLVCGGSTLSAELASCERFRPTYQPSSRRPSITAIPAVIAHGPAFDIVGTRFRGDSEAGDGGTRSSASNLPLVHLLSIENRRMTQISPDPRANLSDDPMTLTLRQLPASLDAGPHLLTITTAGVPSPSQLVGVACSVSIGTQPTDRTVPVGDAVTFSVVAQGARRIQWQKDGGGAGAWADISGATGTSYTTPPVTGADSGSRYRVVVEGNCPSAVATSNAATLTVSDNSAPAAAVMSPSGGEYWLLSPDSAPVHTQQVTWSMSDDVRICQVSVSLLYSNDGGTSYSAVPNPYNFGPSGPKVFGPGGSCTYAQAVNTTNLAYGVPSLFPSGSAGSLYKVELAVTDQVGNNTTVRSASPFYIVQPNPDTVRTLILANTARMQSQTGITPTQAEALINKLEELAGHPRVQGLVVDLGGVTELSDLYSAWDADSSNPDRANQVLFGCHAPLPAGCTSEKNGVHDQIRTLLQAYTGVKYVIVVGEDRIIPFARLQDRTLLLPESSYTSGPDLTALGTTVGQALAANKYLSDDPLGVVDAVRPESLSTALYIPDLAVGRLVETPEEITTAIATFISQDGVLDLSVLNATTGHKVLVTGYDFLTDSAKQIRTRWKTAFGADPDPYSLSPVDGELVGGNWGLGSVSARVDALETHLSGNGRARYGVSSLSGHANHYQEGVPGTSPFDIDGLDASSIAGLNLAGGVIYAVGCHGGLPVSGSNASDLDHSLDLPQTFLSRGVVTYVANTGYGWGLKHGIGYGERLVQLLTEEMTRGGTIVTGDAVKRTKQKYYLESPRFDSYDQKSLMQWTLFGLPMYGVKTGLASGGKPGLTDEALAVRPALERVGPVRVKRSAGASISNQTQTALPSYLTQLNLHFDFTAPGVYRKWTAGGDDVTASSPSGCPDANGCYYTLNGQVERAGGMTDLPVQPYFIYDSRLSGTSQHGVIWKGGVYEQESGWVPIVGELQSNGGDGSEHGPLPEEMTIDVVTTRTVPGQDPDQCRPSELELNSLVVNAGEALKDQGTGLYSIERKYREIDLEVFYFNDTVTSTNNCDRVGPAFGTAPYHSVLGPTIQFAVPVTDASGVWRVLVVYNKNTLDAQNRGRWEPLELTDDGSGVWRGSAALPGVSRLTYMLQAVDNRGNVSWLRFESAELPASGVPLGIPLAVRVTLVSPTGSGSLIDYDQDSRSDHTVFHSASGTWYLRNSSNGAVSAVGYGGPGYTVVPGDYDGDGITDLGAYHPPSGLWFIRNSTTMTTTTTGFGGPDYKPVRGDFDGDRKTDIAVFHDPTGLWFIRKSSTGTVDTIGYGASGYVPVPADYDGDGKTDLAVYHPPTGLWFTRASSTLVTTTTGFGGMAYKPVRGDFDGDGKDDLAVYHEASGLWFIKRSSTGAMDTIGYGGPGYVPVPGRYDSDTKTDVAVYHEPSGLWFMRSSLTGASTAIGFGGSGYVPVN